VTSNENHRSNDWEENRRIAENGLEKKVFFMGLTLGLNFGTKFRDPPSIICWALVKIWDYSSKNKIVKSIKLTRQFRSSNKIYLNYKSNNNIPLKYQIIIRTIIIIKIKAKRWQQITCMNILENASYKVLNKSSLTPSSNKRLFASK
jgi:hypothetical protein